MLAAIMLMLRTAPTMFHKQALEGFSYAESAFESALSFCSKLAEVLIQLACCAEDRLTMCTSGTGRALLQWV